MLCLLGGLLWLVFLCLSEAQYEVTIEQGPLYRTAGSDITIWCKVSGYKGASNPVFQYFVRLPSSDTDINLVSSDDPNFSYAKYTRRVQNGQITVERVSRHHTALHMKNVQEEDTGEYECFTPITDDNQAGTFSAKTSLTVIPNTLQVSMPRQTVTTSEGASLELTCYMSVASSQHTHLSISWLLSTDVDTEVLTLSRDFVLIPGGAFSERFEAGDVRLDKLREASYRLTIRSLRPSDQGEIFCRGSEWIQDHSGEWTKIAEKVSEKTDVKVVALRDGDFDVQMTSSAEVVAPGGPLEVSCSITNVSPGAGQFHVVWLLGGTRKVTWEPSGVVTFSSELGSSGAEGRLAARRRDLTSWVLRISQVRINDGGSYVCEVTDERGKKRTSRPTSVEVKVPELRTPRLSLTMVSSQPYEGDSVEFRCQVSASSSSSSAYLGWFRRAISGDWTHVVSARPDGRLMIGADYQQRHDEGRMLAEKVDSGLFRLRIDDMTQSDGGEYVCRYAEEIREYDGDWKIVTTDSNGVQTDVQRLDLNLEVSLMTRNVNPKLGSTATLNCRAKAKFKMADRRLSWSWFFKPDTDRQGPFQSLFQGPGNGGLVWGDSYHNFKGKAQISLSTNTSDLQIHRVQQSQQSGAYRCSVTILSARSGATLATVYSSDVTINVQLPDMKLRLDSISRPLVLTTGQDEAAVTCRILERTPGTVLSVRWLFHPSSSASEVEVLRVDREGVASQNPSSRPRFISGRSPADSFTLRILRPGLGDLGDFRCAVQEWLPEEAGTWIQLGEGRSGNTKITFAASDQALKLLKQNLSSSIRLGEDLVLPCSLEAGPSPSSLLAVSWFEQMDSSSIPHLLYRAGKDGVTESRDRRLRMEVPERGNYSLVVHSAEHMDGGKYFCRVEEWRLQEGEWKMAASDQSGFLEISVSPPEHRLTLNITDFELLVPQQSTVTLPCQVLAVSLPNSLLSIFWWKAGGPGAPHTLLFSVNHTGEFIYPQEKKERLQFERPSMLTFHLNVHRSHKNDSGTYYCQVQEWASDPRGVWQPIDECQSGEITVTVHTAESLSEICTSPRLFYALLAFTVLFVMLVLALVVLVMLRLRSRRHGGALRTPGALWASVRMSEVEKFDGSHTQGADDSVNLEKLNDGSA